MQEEKLQEETCHCRRWRREEDAIAEGEKEGSAAEKGAIAGEEHMRTMREEKMEEETWPLWEKRMNCKRFAAREVVATVGENMDSYRRITAGKDVVPAGLDEGDAG